MELPVTLSFVYFFFVRGGPQASKPVPRLLAGVMCFHYAYRLVSFQSRAAKYRVVF